MYLKKLMYLKEQNLDYMMQKTLLDKTIEEYQRKNKELNEKVTGFGS